MNRVQEIKNTIAHKKAIYCLYRTKNTQVNLLQVICHDLGKLIMIIIIGDNLATKLHRKFAGHHQLDNPDQKQFAEAYLDWASARITKPSKPLDAVQTAKKWYPHLYQRAKTHYKIVGYK